MFRQILLCSDGSAGAAGAAQAAIWFAQKLPAQIRIIHVTDIRLLEGPLLADLSGALGAQPYPALLSQVREIQATRAQAILGAAGQLCEKSGVRCDTVSVTGSLVHTLLEHEAGVDLIVLGQRGEHAAWHRDMLGSSVERIVRAARKPCLITVENFRECRKLLIAYDGSDESTKALHAGLNLAVALGASVELVTAYPPDQEAAARHFLAKAHELAAARGLATRSQAVCDNPEEAILQTAENVDADLIVMGAYGHSRIREWIIGSTTTRVLQKTSRAVLLVRAP